MGFFESLFGSEDKISQNPTMTKGQQSLLNNQISQTKQLGKGGYQDAMGLLQQYLNPESDIYKNFEQPYLNEFNQQTIPALAERFGGANAMGSGLSTSGFGQSLGAAGANLQAQLAQMKQQFQRQSINDLLNQYNQLSNQSLNAKSFENTYQPGSTGLIGGALEGVIGGLGTGTGLNFGNKMGNFFSPGNDQQNKSNAFSIG